jgi:hypothetical protein
VRVTLNNTLQQKGNKSKPTTVTDPAYLSAKGSMEETFEDVLRLEPHPSLHKWKSVSNIPIGELDDCIKGMEQNAYKLNHPLSTAEISALTTACTIFRVAKAKFKTVTRSRQTKGEQKKCKGIV